MHLSSAFSEVGGGGGWVARADVAEYGHYMGTLQQISALVAGEMWRLRFLNALLLGRMWDFVSVQLRGDWERSIVCLINGKMGDEKKVSFKDKLSK